MTGEKPLGHVERDPRPTRDLGGLALSSPGSVEDFRVSELDDLIAAYAGYPDVIAELTSRAEEVPAAEVKEKEPPKETIAEKVLRTVYVGQRQPVQPAGKKKVETLTTKAL